MKKIGLIYAIKEEDDNWLTNKILNEFGHDKIEKASIDEAWQNDFGSYSCFILCVSVWFDGELPTYWDSWLPELHTLQLEGKMVAIIGQGDQVHYPGNSAPGLEQLAEVLMNDGATLICYDPKGNTTATHKYTSLVIDMNNKSEATMKTVRGWCSYVKGKFEL